MKMFLTLVDDEHVGPLQELIEDFRKGRYSVEDFGNPVVGERRVLADIIEYMLEAKGRIVEVHDDA